MEPNQYATCMEADTSNKIASSRKLPLGTWWWPFVVSIVLTPVAMLGEVSYGHAHSENVIDRIFVDALFPLSPLFNKLVESENAKGLFVLLQFPVYGVIISLCARRNRLPRGSIAVAMFHSMTYVYVKM